MKCIYGAATLDIPIGIFLLKLYYLYVFPHFVLYAPDSFTFVLSLYTYLSFLLSDSLLEYMLSKFQYRGSVPYDV
jgi:hypothetical protein